MIDFIFKGKREKGSTSGLPIQTYHVNYMGDLNFYGTSGFWNEYINFDETTQRALRDFVKSWTFKYEHTNRSIWLCNEIEALSLSNLIPANNQDVLYESDIYSSDQILSSLSSLNLEDKLLMTLSNLVRKVHVDGNKISFGVYGAMRGVDTIVPFWNENVDDSNPTPVYCASGHEAVFILNALLDYGYLTNEYNRSLRLTTHGYEIVSELNLLKRIVPYGFFIRKYDVNLDRFYKPIISDIESKTKSRIKAVWEDPKNEKLDDLILRRIRESHFVISDISGERFNVGLELGYAMASGKEIVLVKDEESGESIPFDIRTLNCLFYNRKEPEEFLNRLYSRVKDAINTADSGPSDIL